jgi:hypothetical protein
MRGKRDKNGNGGEEEREEERKDNTTVNVEVEFGESARGGRREIDAMRARVAHEIR